MIPLQYETFSRRNEWPFLLLFCSSSNMIVLLCKMGVHRTISQRSNTYIQSYYKFDENLENILMFFVAFSMKELL
jgi:hypothetical protein